MAFMMPVVKKNYTLYANPGSSGAGETRQRRTSEQLDTHGNPKFRIIGTNGAQVVVGRRRKTKSEGQSLSTSPGGIIGSGGGDGRIQQRSKPVDMGIRRGRGSAPVLIPGTLPINAFSHQHSSKMPGGIVRPSTSAPTGNSPVHANSESRSSISSSSSSSDSNTTGIGAAVIISWFRRKPPPTGGNGKDSTTLGPLFPDETFSSACLDLVVLDLDESIVWCRDCNLPLCSKCGGPNEHMYTDRLCHFKSIKDLISSGPGPCRVGRFTELAEIYLDVSITRFLMMQTNSKVFEKEIQLVLADTEVQRILFGVEGSLLGHVLNARPLPVSFFATRQKELRICRAYAILVASGNNFKSVSEIKVGVFHPILTNLTPSCNTNVVMTVNQMERNLELRSGKKILPGEPISLDYMDYPLLTADQRKRLFKFPWSSKCICTTCFAHKDFAQYQTSAETFDYNKYYENPIYSEVRIKVEPKSAPPVNIENYGGSGDAQPQVPVRVEYVDASGDGSDMSHVTLAGTSMEVSIKHLEEEEPAGVDKRRLTRPRGLVALQLLDAIEDRIPEDEEAQPLAGEGAIEEANHVALPEQEVGEAHPVEEDKEEETPVSEEGPVEPPGSPPPRQNLLLEAMNSEENAERVNIRMVQLEQFPPRKEARQQRQRLEVPDVTGQDVVGARPEPEIINLVTKMSPSQSPVVMTSIVSAPEPELSTPTVLFVIGTSPKFNTPRRGGTSPNGTYRTHSGRRNNPTLRSLSDTPLSCREVRDLDKIRRRL